MNQPLRSFFAAAAIGLLAACGSKPTSTPPAGATPTADTSHSATVSEVVNIVEAKTDDANAFTQVNSGAVVGTGGEVRTGDISKARLDFSDGSIIRLAQNSTFAVQKIETDSGGLLARVKLTIGKIWISLSSGAAEVETPVGVASVRGSFAVIAYDPGDPNNPDDDVLILDCLEGTCSVQNANVNETLGNLQGLVLTGGAHVDHIILTGAEVEDFLNNNPEGQPIRATLTAAAPQIVETSTETQAAPTATDTETVTPPPTTTSTSTSVPAPTSTHTRVPPRPTSTGTPTPTGTITPTPTATCEPGSFYDPFQKRCRPPDTPVTPATDTPTPVPPTATPIPPTATPIPPTPTATPDTAGPSITNLTVNPASVGSITTCSVTFTADISDPSGVSLAQVDWTATNVASQVTTGSVPMTFVSGTQWQAGWTVTFSPSFPYYGTVTWSITAIDGLSNMNAVASVVVIDAPAGGGWCI